MAGWVASSSPEGTYDLVSRMLTRRPYGLAAIRADSAAPGLAARACRGIGLVRTLANVVHVPHEHEHGGPRVRETLRGPGFQESPKAVVAG
jgi:hypothetical protein